mmetsp:Transcript_23285/g.54176  ORF Transcript_23285/g.54176 Transcript_23285/m.54176 type:complete len:128 (+) Transcript_23285:2451-2834(+)
MAMMSDWQSDFRKRSPHVLVGERCVGTYEPGHSLEKGFASISPGPLQEEVQQAHVRAGHRFWLLRSGDLRSSTLSRTVSPMTSQRHVTPPEPRWCMASTASAAQQKAMPSFPGWNASVANFATLAML